MSNFDFRKPQIKYDYSKNERTSIPKDKIFF